MTTSLLITAALAIGPLCAHLSRAAVLLALSRLALRHTQPAERGEILHALTHAFTAIGPTRHTDDQERRKVKHVDPP
jgi:hypothetical protein